MPSRWRTLRQQNVNFDASVPHRDPAPVGILIATSKNGQVTATAEKNAAAKPEKAALDRSRKARPTLDNILKHTVVLTRLRQPFLARDQNRGVCDMAQQVLRILLVADSPHVGGVVRRELRHECGEPQIQEAANESEFAAALNADEFDLVITDYQLRWADGLQVLRAVKERFPDCPVLMFTAAGNERIAVEAMKAGLDDYIIKDPHHMVRLRAAARSVLASTATLQRVTELDSRLLALLTQWQVGAFSCTLDRRCVKLNPAMIELLGSKRAEGPGSLMLESLFPTPDQADNFLRQVPADATKEIELEIEQPSGASRFVRLIARRVDVAGAPPRIDGLLEDITDRKRAEAHAQQAAVAQARIEMLSPREKQVFDEVVTGGMNKTIARRFYISEKTVERHRSNMMKKLHVRSVAELARLATLAEIAAKKDS